LSSAYVLTVTADLTLGVYSSFISFILGIYSRLLMICCCWFNYYYKRIIYYCKSSI